MGEAEAEAKTINLRLSAEDRALVNVVALEGRFHARRSNFSLAGKNPAQARRTHGPRHRHNRGLPNARDSSPQSRLAVLFRGPFAPRYPEQLLGPERQNARSQ